MNPELLTCTLMYIPVLRQQSHTFWPLHAKKSIKIREIMLIKDMDTVAETTERWPKTSWREN